MAVMTAAAAIKELDDRIQSQRPSRIAFLNAHLANTIAADTALQAAISSFLVLNDGIGVDIASQVLYGERFPDNLVGTDFVPRYLAQTRHDLRIGLLGGTEPVITKAAAAITQKWPRHQIVFHHHGFFDPCEEDAIALAMSRAACQIALVAMGNPRQEHWISRNVPKACILGIGVGALFDHLSGAVRRAPPIVLRLRLEWVYRLLTEPGRLWRRYLIGNWEFVRRLAAEASKRGMFSR